MTKLAPEWVRTSNPVIRSPARYRWTTTPVKPSLRSALNNSILTVTHAYAHRHHIACFFIGVHISLSSKHLLQRNPFIRHLRTVLHIPAHSGNALPVYYPQCHASRSNTVAFEDSSKTLVNQCHGRRLD